ncbi:MAG: T9SS type A sorting domain-containing protein, partial [bacterium]
VAKYDGSGNVQWANQAGGSDTDSGFSVSSDKSGNIVATGWFSGSASFGSTILTSAGQTDIFIVQYDALGSLQWVKRAGGTSFDLAYSIATDKFNRFVITGRFSGSATFGSTTLTSAGENDIFVAKYDGSGNELWAKQAGGPDNDYSYGVTGDLAAKIILTGNFSGSATFDGISLTSAGGNDVFIAKLKEFPTWIQVTDPNGGEILSVGTPFKVTWLTDKYTGKVKISLSKDGGANWFELTEYHQPNTGSYNYTPTSEHVSNNCLIKINSSQNSSANDQSDGPFSIIEDKRHYIAVHIPDGVPVPAIDGYLNDDAWLCAYAPQLLDRGGIPNNFLAPWTDFADNKVTWKAIWSSSTNRLYVAIEVQDDIAGTNDNDFDHLWHDDSIELYTDGDNNGGDFSNRYDIAQQWQIRRDNSKHLGFLAGEYSGPAINSKVTYGLNGNWVFEAELTIYDQYPSIIKYLSLNDVIGWEVWYNDSDDEHKENGFWARDHQVGWGYSGPAYHNADYFHALELGPAPPEAKYYAKRIPNSMSLPTIDGVFNESFWSLVDEDSLLFGGVPEAWGTSWNDWYDNLVTWKAVWSEASNQLYIAITIQDDIRGVFDNNIPNQPSFAPYLDECLELFTDGDHSGGYYEGTYDNAQQWLVNGENKIVLDDYPVPSQYNLYTGTDLETAVSWGSAGNWTCEAAFNIYNTFPSVRKTLSVGDIIGWNIWYDDSDNETQENGTYLRDHQVGWFYEGKANNNADYFGDIQLAGDIPIQQHFTPIWTGNPFQPMTIYCTKAELNEQPLLAGDEIAIFDGDKCVGAKELTQIPSQTHPVEIICSKDDGTGNGFIEGNALIFKVWDQSAASEYGATAQFIDLNTGQPVSPVPFTGLGTAAVELTAAIVPHSLPLNAGWNIFSLAVSPEGSHDMLDVLSPILNYLVKVIDEQGHSIIKLFGNWTNSIGNWQATEGYYINVNQNVTLQLNGIEIFTPLSIPLSVGWNIISYPCLSVSQDALSVVQPLIDNGYLVKVIDEQGHSIVQIFGNWNNSIGDMHPGEGYYVNVNANCTLTISCGSPEILVNASNQLKFVKPKHFQLKSAGYPFEPMNIFVTEACVDGEFMNTGDEIAVYDGDRCIGVSVLNSAININNPLEIIASKDDGSGRGFTAGNRITFKIWRSNSGEELLIDGTGIQYLDPKTADPIEASLFERLGTAVVAINLITSSTEKEVVIPHNYHLYQNYPNPFNPTTTIRYDLPEATNVRLEIYDLQGNIVRRLFEGHQKAGHYAIAWDGRNKQGTRIVSGIYFYRLRSDKFVNSKKMILAK